MKHVSANCTLAHKVLRQSPTCFKLLTLGALLGAGMLSGCADLTVIKRVSFRSEILEKKGDYASPGHLYTMRGFAGIFSTGMDTIAKRAEREIGIRATSLADPDWKGLSRYLISQHKAGQLPRPLILCGHSFGADDQVRVAKLLQRENIPVDLLVLVDPGTPPTVPANVKRCVDIYRSSPATDVVPVLRGIKVRADDPSKTDLVNVDVRTAKVNFSVADVHHITIEKKREVQDMALAEFKKTCFP